MKAIVSFVIVCKKCLEESRVNIQWLPNNKFAFLCYTCNELEIISVKGEEAPQTINEFDESMEEEIIDNQN